LLNLVAIHWRIAVLSEQLALGILKIVLAGEGFEDVVEQLLFQIDPLPSVRFLGKSKAQAPAGAKVSKIFAKADPPSNTPPMLKNTLFSLIVAGTCSLVSVSNAAVVLTIDAANELLSFSGTASGNAEEIVPGSFYVLEWESSAPGSSQTFALNSYLDVDAPTVMNFINIGDTGVTISFQFNNSALRSFTGTNAVLDYSSAPLVNKNNLAALAGSSLAVSHGDPGLGAISVVAGNLAAVPEPSAAILLLLGSGLCLRRRR
jgi:hypothetical protein